MNQPIVKPIKRLAQDLLKDSELIEGLVAVEYLFNGDIRVHGAGIVHAQPELVLFASARLVAALMSGFNPTEAGQITIDINAGGKCDFRTTGAADTDPRMTLHAVVQTLIAVASIIQEQNNLMKENVSRTDTEAENSSDP
jgi:hypothetical protein